MAIETQLERVAGVVSAALSQAMRKGRAARTCTRPSTPFGQISELLKIEAA